MRVSQGVNLSKLDDSIAIYKAVAHDKMGIEWAIDQLKQINERPVTYKPWHLVIIYGIASAFVCPLFSGNFKDMGIAGILGMVLGVMALVLAPRSALYANVFEITAAMVTSFAARGFGSIRNGELFCFASIAQASIALILPGWIVLNGALELTSKSIVSGSIRMFYAIIYSLFLGFGITIGASIYGVMDSNATSVTTCPHPMNNYWRFLFVPLFTLWYVSASVLI